MGHAYAEIRLADLWQRLDSTLFRGRLHLHRPILTFGPPVVPNSVGTFAIRRRDGARMLNLDEGLLTGQRPEFGPGTAATPPPRWLLIEDVLTHEMVHAAVHSLGEPWGSHAAHDQAYANLAERIGRKLGLPPVPDRWWAWPMCARPANFYVPDPHRP